MAAIKITGLAEAIAAITDVPKLIEPVLTELAAQAHEGMRQGAGRHSPRPGGTGNLYASLYSKAAPKFREVGHDTRLAPYAQWVIGGSVAHAIKPKKAKMLRWFAWPGGPPVFSKGVWHPGYSGDNYLDRSADAAVQSLASIVDRTLRG